MIIRLLARHFRSPRTSLTMDPHPRIAECLHALESRYLFDAAGVAVGAEAAADALAQEQADQAIDALNHGPERSGGKPEPGSAAQTDSNDELLQALTTHEPPAGRREIVFIDTSVEDYQKLIAGIDPSAEVVLLDATRDGVEQIADVLTGRSGIDAIHIVSHGSQAELRLGTARLSVDSMNGQYADELEKIGQALSDKGDLLVYGCDFGRGDLGQEAAATLGQLTGADVAVSDDLTGSAALGGDWDLELRAGLVETTAVLSFEAQASFMGLLAAPSIDLDANNSAGTLGADYTAQYPVAGGSLPVTDIDARLADADSATLSSLTVTLTNRPDAANESLSADTTGTLITVSYNGGTGVLSLSGADTVGNYQRVLRTITYGNAALAPDRTDRLITFVVNDGTGDSNVGTTTATFWENVRDDFSPAAYDGNDGSANWSTDWQEVGESNGPASGRVQVTSASLEISTLLAGVGMRGATREADLSGAASATLSFSYQRSSGLISTSEASVQVWNGASWDTLATYDLNDSDPTPIAQQFDLTPSQISSSTQIRFITNTLSFEGVSSSISFDDIDISYDAHGSAPILDLDANDSSGASGANFSTTFTEDGGAVVVADADAVLTDADSTTLTELVVTIINPLDGAAESLSANTAGTSITASYDPATATLTLSGTDTVANYQQVLRTITYDNTSQSPNTAAARTITFQASDGTDHSDVAFATVTVIAVNDPPVVATTVSALAYTENDPATAVDSGLTVSDVDNTTLTGATVTISANYVNGEDVLGFTDQLGITGSWNVATGTLTLTGTTTLANYQAALRTIAYANLSNGPSTLARTVSFVINDGSANSAVATRTINVTAVNDAPVITSNGGGATASVNVAENTTAVTTVTSTDTDGAAPIYSILAGGDGGFFSIDPNSGALTFNLAPNFEAPADVGADNVYDVTVQVWDGIIGGTDTQAIAVTVTNVNEPPVVNDQAFSVAENTANGTPVGTVIAADVDAGDTRTFSITAGNTGGAFTIDSAGVITVASTAALDFETNPTFTLTVQVQDLGGLTDTAIVTVSLTNVNEPPVVNDQAFSVAENTANGTLVGTVIAADVDAGDTRTFSITAGNTGGAFAIDTTTGQITVANAAALDFETNPTFTLTVQVQDAGGLNDIATVTVNLTDLNDAPVITSNGGGASASVSTAENTTAVTTVSATDADLPAQILSYAISGADAALFTIDSATGVLRFSSAPDFEAPADANVDNVYEVTVRASDGSLTDTQALSVTVTPVNEAPSGTDTTVTTNEDTTYSFAAIDFGFTDGDPGDVLSAVRIDTLPAADSLTLSGVAVSAGQVVSMADLTAGNLLFTPAANANGSPYASFSFSVRDTGGAAFDPTPNTMTVNVAAVNDAPVNTVPGPQTVVENTALALNGVSVNDAEGNLSTLALSVANGTLTVTLQGGTTISAGANGSAALTLLGTQADLTATLASLVYQGNYIGPDTLTVTSTDSSRASDTDTIAITVIATAPASPAPPGTGDGTPEGSPSAPGPAPGPGHSLPSKVDDGSSSKTGFERNIIASDDSRVTASAPSTRAPAVSSKHLGSDKNFIDGTSQGLGAKQPVAKKTNAAVASAADVQDAKDPYSTLEDNRFLEELNRLRDDMNHPLSMETVALSLGLSVGYAIWLLRGGVLLSSLLSSLPAWRWLDPLPVLAHLRDPRDDEEGDEDSLQAMLKNAEAREPSKPIPDLEVVPPVQQAATGAALSQPDASASLQEKADSHVSPHSFPLPGGRLGWG